MSHLEQPPETCLLSMCRYVVARNAAEAGEKARALYGEGCVLVQEADVLDTWFSSGLWPFSTLGWPNTDTQDYKTFYPTQVRPQQDVLLQGCEAHRADAACLCRLQVALYGEGCCWHSVEDVCAPGLPGSYDVHVTSECISICFQDILRTAVIVDIL